MEKSLVIKYIIKSYQQMGLSFEVLKYIENYLKGANNEEKIAKFIKNQEPFHKDFVEVVSAVVTKFLVDIYLEDKDLKKRILKSFFLLGKENTFDCYELKVNFLKGEIQTIYETLEKINVPFYYYIKNQVKGIFNTNRPYVGTDMNKAYFIELKNLYTSYKKDYIDAFYHSEELEKLCLGIVLFNEDDLNIKNIDKFVDSKLKEMLFKSFKIDDAYKEKINDYIDGKHHILCEEWKDLERLIKDKDYRIKISIVYHSCKKSEVAKKILKLLIHFHKHKTIDLINNYETIDPIFEFINAGEERHGTDGIKIHKRAQEFLSVLKTLEIEESFYISWAAYQCFNILTYEEDKVFLRGVIKNYFKENIAYFKEATQITHGIAKDYLESFLINLKDEDERRDEVNRKCIETVKGILEEHNFSDDEIDDFVLYMKGHKEIDEVFIPPHFKTNDYSAWGIRKETKSILYNGGRAIRPEIKKIVWCYGIEDAFERVVLYFIKLENPNLLDYLADEFIAEQKGTFQAMIKLFNNLGIEIKDIIYMISCMKLEGHYQEECENLINNWIETRYYEVIDSINLCKPECRADLINSIYESGFYKKDKEKFILLLKDFITDSSKVVKETVYNVIEKALKKKERKALGMDLLGAKKVAMRQGAIRVLKTVMDKECKSILKEHLEKEKSSNVKKQIMENLSKKSK